VKWYGPARKYHFAEDLVPGSRGGRQAESHLAKLLGDTAVPAIVKATAAAYLGNDPNPTGLKLLLDCLRHPDAQVRYRATRSLDGFSFTLYRDAALPLLQDKVRAVRIAAADLFLAVPPEQVPAEYKPALQAARQELDAYIHYQADFAVGNVMIADYYMKQQNHSLAEIYYKRGLKKDSLMNYARFNLAALYNTIGKNDLALQTLQTALKTDPGNDRVHYNLALLYSEMRDMDKAGFHFKEAIRLGTENPRVYYNYGVMLQQKGELQSAEKVLLKGIAKAPGDISLSYALAYYYILKKEPSKALVYAMVLKQADPENPDYAPLFQNLGLK
jgi:tetratricopeptide (TPR) repeat protein